MSQRIFLVPVNRKRSLNVLKSRLKKFILQRFMPQDTARKSKSVSNKVNPLSANPL